MISIKEAPEAQQIHISHSQLKTYSTCSLQWLFGRKYKPAFVSSSLVFGSAFHKALQAFYQGQLENREITVTDMLKTFTGHWDTEDQEVRYSKNESRESLHETAGRMFKVFLDQVEPGQVIAVEERFECRLASDLPWLVGFIDLVEIRNDNGARRLHLTDFKTAARKPTDIDHAQLTLYAIAAHKIGLLKQFALPFCLDYLVITKTKNPEVIRITIEPDRHEALRLIAKAKVCWKGMDSGLCFPNPSWMCAGCGFQDKCKDWPTP